jgi:site-specific recombinase XerC
VALVARYREHAAAHHRCYAKSRYTLGQLEAEFGDIPLADLSAFRIDKWKLARRKLVAASTVNRDLNVLKAILAQAVTWKFLDTNPAAGVKPFKVPQGRVRFLMPDELARLLTLAHTTVSRRSGTFPERAGVRKVFPKSSGV